MRFDQPQLFWLLFPVAALGIFLWWAFGRRRSVMGKFVERKLIEEIAANFSFERHLLKGILLIVVLVFAVAALARPQWGFKWQEIKREGLDILVVIDVSKSMLTQDVKPNRLERAKLAVKDLVKKLKGDRIGLVAFAGSAFLTCPLTVDYSGYLLSLDDLDTNTIPRGGTAMGSAIKEAIRAYANIPSQYKAVIILTDGDNLEGDPLTAAKEAKEKGIKIFCIGLGTKEGELIRIDNGQGSLEFLKDDQGNFVKSRLNEGLLQEIALTTGGTYIRAGGAEFGLDVIYDQQLSKMEKREIESKMEKKYLERFQIPLSLALAALVLETVISTRKKI